MLSAEYPKFITTCDEDEDGNLIINFPEELLDAMGWKEGTTLDIDVIGNGIVLRAVELSNSGTVECS
jgi:bifunctional DNA-binding transcriptional regulator/antitoxin component of YhaV-PrlF toxin-antitoxin module